jgi:hypothetical protein
MRHLFAGTLLTALALMFTFAAASLAGSVGTDNASGAYLAAREAHPKAKSILLARVVDAHEEHCAFSNARDCDLER